MYTGLKRNTTEYALISNDKSFQKTKNKLKVSNYVKIDTAQVFHQSNIKLPNVNNFALTCNIMISV